MTKQVYSLCFMCTVRCPILVEVENDQVTWIQGNPNVAGVDGKLCPRGAAGRALISDEQRVQYPMIRTGPRGSGQWKRASWDEALDFVADKLKAVIAQHGPQSVALGERTQLATHVSKTFVKALGSPNHFTHDSLCKGSINTACRSLFGIADGAVGMDYGNVRHMILYGRNVFEAIKVKEVRQLTEALEKGAKLTYIDPRVTVTAAKAHRYWMIRPGTDLALNYALMNVIINRKLYDREFVSRWVLGFDELQAFVQPYTTEWAEVETGIPAAQIEALAHEAADAAPAVVFNYGYRGSNYINEIHFRRSILMLNALMGSVEARGGIFFKKGPGELGRKAPRKLTEQELPEPEAPRFDGAGGDAFPIADSNHGVAQMLPHAILNKDPYPVKALIAFRFDPAGSIGDTENTIKAFHELDLLVAIDINHSDTAHYADVILPECAYLERTDCVQQMDGLKPQLFLRKQAVTPRYDSRPGAMILKAIADRMGLGQYFPYESMDDLVNWQLESTGFTMQDFESKGFVSYGKDAIYWDRRDGLKLKTPSGKIEFKSALLENAGFESFPAYEPVAPPPAGRFRLTVGRSALHTHGSTQNNPLLHEITPENTLWIHESRAAELGIANGDLVEIASHRRGGLIRAFVTPLIHPEAVFMLHGFGRRNALAARTAGRGVSDAQLQENVSDAAGGSPAFHHTFVTVRPARDAKEQSA